MLKHPLARFYEYTLPAAAFGRLCVETLGMDVYFYDIESAAAFGRLCVETSIGSAFLFDFLAAAFGRLCVETKEFLYPLVERLAAAFGRLCVETDAKNKFLNIFEEQPPSGGCVLKQK